MTKNIYQNTKAVLTTKHGKELLINRPFRMGLGIDVITPEGLDTDQLGTFTGEIPRQGSMHEVLIRKARMGMDLTGLSYGIASEGSFGSHPELPFASCDFEMLVFIDDKQKYILVESFMTTKTNFACREVKKNDDLTEFLHRVGFPHNGLIVKSKTTDGSQIIFKGLKDIDTLREAIKKCSDTSADEIAHVETDMRAHMNYSRRQAIRRLAFKLVKRLRQQCPACKTPGWGLVDIEKGLPCEICEAPTHLIRTKIMGCCKCLYRESKPRTDHLLLADAKYCTYCNP